MLKKIKYFFLDMLFAPSGAALLVFAIMLLISLFNLINTTLFFSGNAFLLLMVPLSFCAPLFFYWISRGGKKYLPTLHFGLPKRVHLPTIAFASLLMFLGSVLLKIFIFDGKYTEFSIYNTFWAHRNGNFWNDIYLVLAFCLIPPVLEGAIFRGALIREYDKRGRMTSTVVSSILFALLGFSFDELLPRFFLGALLCIVLYATESITASIALHIAYNFFAIFFEPMLVSIKDVSSNVELFVFLLAIITLAVAILLLSHLSRLYRKYSHDKFGENATRSTPREKTFWNIVELLTSIPAIACYVIFIIVSLILAI